MVKNAKIRVNVSVDRENLEKAKKKLYLFGGKLSTLFNRYLEDFVKSSEEGFGDGKARLNEKIEEIEKRVKRLEHIGN